MQEKQRSSSSMVADLGSVLRKAWEASLASSIFCEGARDALYADLALRFGSILAEKALTLSFTHLTLCT